MSGAVIDTGTGVADAVESPGATPALAAGVIRDTFGEYTDAWWGGAALRVIATVLSITVKRARARGLV